MSRRERQSGQAGNSSHRVATALPQYQPLEHPFTATQHRKLAEIANPRDSGKLQTRLKTAASTLALTCADMIDRLGEMEKIHTRWMATRQKEERDTEEDREEERVREEKIQKMRVTVKDMEKQMEELVRQLIDGGEELGAADAALKEIVGNAASFGGSTQARSSQRQRQRHIDPEDDMDEDENVEASRLASDTIAPAMKLQQSLAKHMEDYNKSSMRVKCVSVVLPTSFIY
jgi:hypothetical protein